MTDQQALFAGADAIIKRYAESFKSKAYSAENNDSDLLMQAFGIGPELKRENRQYWGRELGMCWQLIVIDWCKRLRLNDYGPAIKVGQDEPCDLVLGKYAIDTKYRIGSGDSGTLKKFKSYGPMLKGQGAEPVFLILREDNLPAAITACLAGGWTVLTGDESFEFIERETGASLRQYLEQRTGAFDIGRSSSSL